MEEVGFDVVVFVGVFVVVVVILDVDINLLVVEEVVDFGCVGYNGNIGFVVVFSVVGLVGVGIVDVVVLLIFFFDKIDCWVVLILLVGLVFLLGFKMFNIFVWRFVCCLVMDCGLIVGWLGWVVVMFDKKVGVNGIMMNS